MILEVVVFASFLFCILFSVGGMVANSKLLNVLGKINFAVYLLSATILHLSS